MIRGDLCGIVGSDFLSVLLGTVVISGRDFFEYGDRSIGDVGILAFDAVTVSGDTG